MAKGNMLLGQARGKVGSIVFAVVKGQQVERPYIASPANPRTYSQQSQRILLANMTKFYKRATSNFYKFAFEDKTSRESDYNAFARNNIKRGAYLTKEQYDAEGFPAIGRYIMTKGSLPVGLQYGWVGDWFGIATPFYEEGDLTLGTLSTYLMNTYPAIEAGDIVTFVRAWSALDLNLVIPGEKTEWQIAQFYIDPTDQRKIEVVGLEMGVSSHDRSIVGFNIDGTTSVSMGSVCISRRTTGGLKVSDSQLVLSPLGQVIMDWLASGYQQRQAAITWGGNPDAILAGGQLMTLPEISGIELAGQTQAAWQRRDILFSGTTGILCKITGTNLKTTAQGGTIVVRYYAADTTDDNSELALSPTKTTTLTATGTETELSTAIPNTARIIDGLTSTQGFYSLEYNGVVIAFGTCIASE